jgi:GT2 family glycosyltransferase
MPEVQARGVARRSSIAQLAQEDSPRLHAWCQLSPHVLLLLLRVPSEHGGPPRVELEDRVKRTRLKAWQCRMLATNLTSPPLPDTLIAIRQPRRTVTLDAATFVLSFGDHELRLEPEDRAPLALPVETLMERYLRRADGTSATQLLAVLQQIARSHGADPAYAEIRRRLNASLRVPLISCSPDPRARCAGNVDVLWRIDDSSYYIEGWLLVNGSSDVASLAAISPEGDTVELRDVLYRYWREDLAGLSRDRNTKIGFVGYFETNSPSIFADGWVLAVRLEDGYAAELAVPAALADLRALRTAVLADQELELLPEDELRRRHIKPALERMRRSSEPVRVATRDDHGDIPSSPEISIVVPVHGRLDLIQHQLAQFAHDPDLGEVELIYVLDSPEHAIRARSFVRSLYRLYGIPLRLVILSQHAGMAAAQNLGVGSAAGRLVVLLDSDVLPIAPRWLSRLKEAHDRSPTIGAVGAKLLYEDDSIQHAGLDLEREPDGTWTFGRRCHALSAELPASCESRTVAAVSGACMMLPRELFERLGGMSRDLVEGLYADRDLCLRLWELGYTCWYEADVVLHHLAGFSFATSERADLAAFNEWLLVERWGPQLDELSCRVGGE